MALKHLKNHLMGTWSLNLLSYLGTWTLETLSHLKATGSLGHLALEALGHSNV